VELTGYQSSTTESLNNPQALASLSKCKVRYQRGNDTKQRSIHDSRMLESPLVGAHKMRPQTLHIPKPLRGEHIVVVPHGFGFLAPIIGGCKALAPLGFITRFYVVILTLPLVGATKYHLFHMGSINAPCRHYKPSRKFNFSS